MTSDLGTEAPNKKVKIILSASLNPCVTLVTGGEPTGQVMNRTAFGPTLNDPAMVQLIIHGFDMSDRRLTRAIDTFYYFVDWSSASEHRVLLRLLSKNTPDMTDVILDFPSPCSLIFI
ncbi:hypothetical protein BaRGS_00024026 [Batillaria attramentaria]|uniref:Uncharacterized protein n=1 Tax=Batillaria attramentaria TaxID=370345 RepID=A0ABD0KCD2_9CAEN